MECTSVPGQMIKTGFLIKTTQKQSNFNCLNSFGTMQICSRHGKFELMSVNHSARSGGIIGISFQFSSLERYVVCFL